MRIWSGFAKKSQFTADTVQAYKSLEAYNYFESGFVQDCKLWKPQGAAVCFVRAKVMPSQRATTEPHEAWVCLSNASGGAQMVPLDEINLCKPGKPARRIPKEPDHVAAVYVPGDEALFRRLQEVTPQAAVLRSIPKLNAEDTDSASEDEETYSLLRSLVDCVLQRRPDVCTEGMQWGGDNEPNAKREYRLFMERNHNDFKLEEIGFVIDTRDSFIGASPDGIWSCSCHGVGILEVKCPAVLKEPGTPITRVDCLNDNLELPTFHKYYTQVQTQLHVCRKSVAHFVVWGPDDLHVQEVAYDKAFFAPILSKARQFWAKHIAPELV
ncbi:hypothetical protein HPB47_008660 [Ixodes persulcatus]|uniref:Uncharacterized protein n=1 Tax=Ixodes persulcatus TaxID=34615 RepID=A0AC60P466_IXOPE|nr:hypothetical protein HPB47_008660 [Ixodes persulcatus]